MKLVYTFLLLCSITVCGQAPENSWHQPLKLLLKTLDTSRSVPVWQAGIDTLRGLTTAQPHEWLLQYYTGWACIQLSFRTSRTEAETWCNQAAPYVKKALEMQPGNTETLALMSYWLSARIKASPGRGAALGPDSRRYSDKAIEADSTNPRAYLMKALVVYYTPAVFGGGKKRAKPIVMTTAEKFAAFKPRSDLAPNWGNAIFEELAAVYK